MEVNGQKVKISIWVRSFQLPRASLRSRDFHPRFVFPLAYMYSFCCCRTLQAKSASAPSPRRTTAARRASSLVRVYPSLCSSCFFSESTTLAHRRCGETALARVYIYIVYDVSSRESFRGISRWLEELEDHAQSDIVKIIVGNKVDKVTSNLFIPFFRVFVRPAFADMQLL
jgi:hypothetical protein